MTTYLKLAATLASFAAFILVSLAAINLGTRTSDHPYADYTPASITSED